MPRSSSRAVAAERLLRGLLVLARSIRFRRIGTAILPVAAVLLAEQENIYAERPELVDSLRTLLERYRAQGYGRPGYEPSP